jgi:diacylglycerol kinase family enzyme
MVYGGDGTLKSVVQKYCQNSSAARPDAAFYFWGAGTGNDFLRQCALLPLPQVMLLRDSSTKKNYIDVGLVEFHDREPEYFLNSFNIGLGGEVAKLKAEKVQTKGYLQLILKALSSFKPQAMKVVLDQERTLAGQYLNLAILNGQYFAGGFLVNPQGYLTDAAMECLTFKKPSLLSIPWQLAILRFGRHQRSPYFSLQKCGSIAFDSPSGPAPMDLDGELCVGQIAKISVLPRTFPLLNSFRVPRKVFPRESS